MNPCRTGLIAFIAIVVAFPAIADSLGEGGTEFWVDGPAEVKLGPSPDDAHSAIDSRGREIYVWSEATYSPSTQGTNIVLRVFSADGESLVGPVQINTYDASHQAYPRVAVSADDSFVVVWQSTEPPEPEDEFLRQIVRSQAFDVDAQPVGVEQVLSNLDPLGTTTIDADIAALKGGGYMTVWQSALSALEAETGTSIQGRLLGSNGVPLAGQFQVNSTLGGAYETDINVTELDDGGFLAVWATPEVNGRRFTAASRVSFSHRSTAPAAAEECSFVSGISPHTYRIIRRNRILSYRFWRVKPGLIWKFFY